MSMSLYRWYLNASWLTKKLEGAGLSLYSINVGNEYWTNRLSKNLVDNFEETVKWGYNFHVSGALGYTNAEEVEARAVTLMEAFPDAQVYRSNGYIYLYGRLPGITEEWWQLSVGKGECEIVQIGTKTVEKVDPEYLVNAPMIRVEEPIFETRCIDPIVKAGLL